MEIANPEAQTEIKPTGLKASLYVIEDIICIASLSLMALLPAMEVLLRFLNNKLSYYFKDGISLFNVPSSAGLIGLLLLATGLIAGMICTRKENHLSISLVQYLPEGKVKRRLKVFGYLLSAFVSVLLACSAISFIKISLDDKTIGYIPVRFFAFIIPISFGVMAFRFARLTNLKGWKIALPVLSIVMGIIFSFPVLAKIYWGSMWDMPDHLYNLFEKFIIILDSVKIPFVLFMIIAAFSGTPLFIVLGGLSLFLLQTTASDEIIVDLVVDNIYSALTNNTIIAIPLFTITGFFLSESKAGLRLVNAFRSLFSWLPGGIIIVTVVICAFFTSFTGASGVTILALGGILYAMLSEHLHYPQKFSIGLLTSVGSIGLLFPPSLPLILVGTVMTMSGSVVNIFHLFIAGVVPGLILVIAMIIFGIIISVKVKIPAEKFNIKKVLLSLKDSAFEILLPVFLIMGYSSGILNDVVEIGAAAVVYVFITQVVIKRDIKLPEIKKVFEKAIPIIGGILMILALSRALSEYIVQTQAPTNIARWMQEAFSSKYVFLLLLNIALLMVGCLMDIFSAIFIILPLIVPLAQAYGIDPVHLGIIFLVNLEVGYITPPVGLNLFLASYRFKRSFIEICRYVSPFLLVRFIVVLLVTYLPWLSTGLVQLFNK